MIETFPVYQKPDGSWWHSDEVWVDEFGPYASKKEAEEHLKKYVHYINFGEVLP